MLLTLEIWNKPTRMRPLRAQCALAMVLCMSAGCGGSAIDEREGDPSGSGGAPVGGASSSSGGSPGADGVVGTGGVFGTGGAGASSGAGGSSGVGGAGDDDDVPPLSAGGVGQLIIAPQEGPIILHELLRLAPRDDGGVYVTGRGGDVTYGDTLLPSTGPFLFALSNAGELAWSATFLGEPQSTIEAIASDVDGNVVVGGRFIGTLQLEDRTWSAAADQGDLFVAKFDRTGELLWAHHFGSEQVDRVLGIVTASDGSIYVSGYSAADIDLGLGVQEMEQSDSFVIKFLPDGTTDWVSVFRGSGDYRLPFGIGLADGGDVLITGWTYGQATLGAFEIGEHEEFRGFVARLDAEGEVVSAFDALIYGGYHIAGVAGGDVLLGGVVEESGSLAGLSIDGEGADRSGFVARLTGSGEGMWATVPVPGSDTVVRPDPAGGAYIAGGSLSFGERSGYWGRVTPAGTVEQRQEWATAAAHDIALAPNGTLWLSAELAGPTDFGSGTPTVAASTHAILRLRPDR